MYTPSSIFGTSMIGTTRQMELKLIYGTGSLQILTKLYFVPYFIIETKNCRILDTRVSVRALDTLRLYLKVQECYHFCRRGSSLSRESG